MSRSDCLSPATLAALVDGRLNAESRRGVVEHLDACEICYEVVVETVRFQEESERKGDLLRPAPSRWSRPARWLPAVAAAVLVLTLLALALFRSASEPALATSELVVAMEGESKALSGTRWESEPPTQAFAPSDRAFRTGVRLLDLRLAIRAGDRVAIDRDLRDLETLLRGVHDRPDRLLAPLWSAAESGDRRELERAVDRLEAVLEHELESGALSFGKWAEAGRRAALAGDEALLRAPGFTRFAEGQLEERPDLHGLRDQLRSAREGSVQWETLQNGFQHLVATAGAEGGG